MDYYYNPNIRFDQDYEIIGTNNYLKDYKKINDCKLDDEKKKMELLLRDNNIRSGVIKTHNKDGKVKVPSCLCGEQWRYEFDRPLYYDGVGYNWIDSLKDTVEKKITDYDLDNAGTKYKYNTPDTKEGYYYRQIFEELFPNRQKVVSPWLPQTQWDNVRKDPSGRAQNAHSKQNNNNNSSSNNNNNSNIEQNTKINVLKDPNLKSIKIKKIDNDLKKNNDDLSTHERCLGFLVV